MVIEYTTVSFVGHVLFSFVCDDCGMGWQVWDLDFNKQKYMTCCRCGVCAEIDTGEEIEQKNPTEETS